MQPSSEALHRELRGAVQLRLRPSRQQVVCTQCSSALIQQPLTRPPCSLLLLSFVVKCNNTCRYFGLLINVAPERLVTPYQSYTLDW
jgi:hypothetical protein